MSRRAQRAYVAVLDIADENGLNPHCIVLDLGRLATREGYLPGGKPDKRRASSDIKAAQDEGILVVLHPGTQNILGLKGLSAIYCLRGSGETIAQAEADGKTCPEYIRRTVSSNGLSQPPVNLPRKVSAGIIANAGVYNAGPPTLSSSPVARTDDEQKPVSGIPGPPPKVTPLARVPVDGKTSSTADGSTSGSHRKLTTEDLPRAGDRIGSAPADDSHNDPVLASGPADRGTESPNSTPAFQDVVVKTKSGSVVVTAADVDEVLNKTYRIALKYDLSPSRPWDDGKAVYSLIEMLGTKEAVIQRYADAAATGVGRFDLRCLKWFADWVSDEIKTGRENNWQDHVKASGRRPRVPRDDSWRRRDV